MKHPPYGTRADPSQFDDGHKRYLALLYNAYLKVQGDTLFRLARILSALVARNRSVTWEIKELYNNLFGE